MWRTDTYWFDVTIVMTFLMLGHLCFGRSVEYQSRWRRLLKSLVGVAVLVGASVWAGRVWIYALLGLIAAVVLIVHGWWLPRKGVNGWTAEPRDRYYALMGLDPTGKRLPRGETAATSRNAGICCGIGRETGRRHAGERYGCFCNGRNGRRGAAESQRGKRLGYPEISHSTTSLDRGCLGRSGVTSMKGTP